ncbi:MAG: methyl-accepting chemotaxis protein [Spirochaetaceae bacterium]|nr:methyl-accepting chemotaxis protein [Spirochaetaceae bacterium]
MFGVLKENSLKKTNNPTAKANSSVLARRITILCLSLVFSISIITTVLSLLSLSNFTNQNLQIRAEISVDLINAEVQNSLNAAINMTNTLAVMAPTIDSQAEMERIFNNLLDVVPSIFEIYFGTTLSRFDGGHFVTATDWDPYGDNPQWDQTRRPWFITAMQRAHSTVITDPYVDDSTGEICVTIVRTAEANGQIIGVVGTDVFLDELTRLVVDHKITSDGSTFIINKEGFYIVNQDQSLVMNENFFETTGSHLRNITSSTGVQVIVEGTTYWASVPVTGMDWFIISTGSTDEFTKYFWQLLWITVIVVLVLSIVATIISLRFSTILTKPITKLSGILKLIADGDLTQTIEVKGKDEISTMTRMLKETQESLRGLIGDIVTGARKLESVGDELSDIMAKSAEAISQINVNMQNMTEKSISQSTSVTETNATMVQIVNNIESLNQNIGTQSASVSRSSVEIEKMIKQISEVTQSLVLNEKNVGNLTAASVEGYDAVRKMTDDITTVMQESERLYAINKVIQDIASQTNLLAMNAAIEAAHAGSVGKGFAVVAGEIRKLAESSSGQAKTVSDVLRKIKSALDSINSASDEVLDRFALIDGAVKTVTEQENNIRIAMETQNAESKEIFNAMQNSQEITEKVRQSSGEMLTGSREVIEEGKNLEGATSALTIGINEVSQGLSTLNATVSRADEIGRENKESVNVLLREVSHFKT